MEESLADMDDLRKHSRKRAKRGNVFSAVLILLVVCACLLKSSNVQLLSKLVSKFNV